MVARAATGVAGVRGKLVTSGGSATVGAGNRERRKAKQKAREQRRRVDRDHLPGAVSRQVTGSAGSTPITGGIELDAAREVASGWGLGLGSRVVRQRGAGADAAASG